MRLRFSPILIALAFAVSGSASAAPPQWAFSDYPCRIQFAVQDTPSGFALLPFYHQDTGFEPAAYRIFAPPPSNAALPWRVLDRSVDRTLVLVQLDTAYPQPIQLTAYTAPAGVPTVDHNPAIKAPFPIVASVHTYRARGIPNTPERLLYMFQNNPRPSKVYPVTDFPSSLPRDDKPALIQFRTYVECPLKGTYSFRISDAKPLLGSLNGVPLANGEGSVQGPDVVPLTLLTATRTGQSPLKLEWKPPGAPDFAPVPQTAYAGPSLGVPRKIELIGRTLQPQFEADLQLPYAFRDLPGGFFPLRLLDRSENWLPYAINQTWILPGNEINTNVSPSLVFTNPGPHTITLAIGDELGFTTSITHVVSWSPAVPKIHTLSAVPFPMAAAWFRNDMLEPALITQGAWPATLEILLTTRLRRLDGSEQQFTRPIPPSHSPLTTRLAACPAGEFDTLSWSLSHKGVVLTNGVFVALHPPFPSRTITLRVDRLEDDAGRRLVFVAPRKPASQPVSTAASNAPVVVIDDFLSNRSAPEPAGTPDRFAGLLSAQLSEPVRVHPLTDWRDPADQWKPLLKLAEVPALAGSDVPCRILLAIGGQDIMASIPPDTFERQAAVLSDLLLQAGHAVTWITPPPFPERPEKARLYAFAIRRVAETRKLPVADLYSLFAGAAPGDPALFDPLQPACLSAHGRKLAVDRISEQLRHPPQGEPALGH